MGRPQVSFVKRQREQAKREKQLAKAAKKAEKKTQEKDPNDGIAMDEIVREGFPPVE